MKKDYVVKAESKDKEGNKGKELLKERVYSFEFDHENENLIFGTFWDAYDFVSTSKDDFPSIPQLEEFYFHSYLDEMHRKSEDYIKNVYYLLKKGYHPEFTINNNMNDRFSSGGKSEKDNYLLYHYLRKNFVQDTTEVQYLINDKIPKYLNPKSNLVAHRDHNGKILNPFCSEVW